MACTLKHRRHLKVIKYKENYHVVHEPHKQDETVPGSTEANYSGLTEINTFVINVTFSSAPI